jgi:hypothetical protein
MVSAILRSNQQYKLSTFVNENVCPQRQHRKQSTLVISVLPVAHSSVILISLYFKDAFLNVVDISLIRVFVLHRTDHYSTDICIGILKKITRATSVEPLLQPISHGSGLAAQTMFGS